MTEPTTDHGPPPAEARAPIADPAVDRLTGLADRDRFARAVDQADRDRDRLLVAMVAVDGMAEINQLCGYDAGDDLLRLLGRALVQRTSVDLTVGRVGPSAFGVLVTPADGREPEPTVRPILADLAGAIDRWVEQRAALGQPTPIAPTIRAGVAAGYGAPTWAQAEAALSATGAGGDDVLLTFDPAHPGLADLRRRQRVAGDLADALHADGLLVEAVPVEPLGPDGESWTRLRLRVPSRSTDPAPPDALDLAVAPGLGHRLDLHLLDRAIGFQAGADRPATTERVSIPLLGPVSGPRSLVADPLATWAGMVIEVDLDRLRAIASGPTGPALAERLDELSWQLAITDFDGGWDAVELAERLPVHHLRLRPDLVAAARPGSVAGGILAATAELAATRGWPLVAPAAPGADPPSVPTPRRDLGITHVDRAPVALTP